MRNFFLENFEIGTATQNTTEYKTMINAIKATERFHMRHLQVYHNFNEIPLN